jgi:hypothetical protein
MAKIKELTPGTRVEANAWGGRWADRIIYGVIVEQLGDLRETHGSAYGEAVRVRWGEGIGLGTWPAESLRVR